MLNGGHLLRDGFPIEQLPSRQVSTPATSVSINPGLADADIEAATLEPTDGGRIPDEPTVAELAGAPAPVGT